MIFQTNVIQYEYVSLISYYFVPFFFNLFSEVQPCLVVLILFVSGAPFLLHRDSLCKRETLELFFFETLELKLVSFWFTIGQLEF